MSSNEEAVIFDMQGFSVHDGPGGRTLVFFKGCPLTCRWCCNPEGIPPRISLMHRDAKCRRCLNCITACPCGAITFDVPANRVRFDRSKCDRCTTHGCVQNCYFQALALAGKPVTLDQLLAKVERDRRFWGHQGGLTLGGGEVMLQHRFATHLLEKCHENFIHTAIETSGYAPWAHYQSLLKHVDWVFVDIKHMDRDQHKGATGVYNDLILSNIGLMATYPGCRVVIRVPLIPGFNDDEDNLLRTAQFMRDNGLMELNILPFHRMGSSKYTQLGQQYEYEQVESVDGKSFNHLKSIFEPMGIRCYLGSDTPF